MKRIGLTQRVDQAPRYEERRDGLDQRWAGFLLSLGYCPVPLANSVKDVCAYLAALTLDGVILTGGNDICEAEGGTDTAPERDRFEHLLLDEAAEKRLPVLGVCRGLQLMTVHHGGVIVPVKGHSGRRHQVSLDLDLFRGCPSTVETNSYHGFAIGPIMASNPLMPVAWADDGTVEAVAHTSLPQFGVMWHPEREDSLTQHDQVILQAAFGGKPA